VHQHFRPEFINRLDEVLTFETLGPEQIRSIVDVQARRLTAQLAEQEIRFELSNAAKDELARIGYDPEFGARPLKRALQKNVQNLCADAILSGRLQAGDLARIDFRQEGFKVEVQPAAPVVETVPA
jgi:ATP-dependent Clp protease ATP-binding subunit ClpA